MQVWMYEGGKRGVPKTLEKVQFSTIASDGGLGRHSCFSRSACKVHFRTHQNVRDTPPALIFSDKAESCRGEIQVDTM
jgi:hypothetical protein